MARILQHVIVVRDGMHNAFTDLAYWRDAYWVSYRKAHRHRFSSIGQAVLSVSADRTRFREAARFKLPGDVRDPNVVVTKDDRLAMFMLQTIVNEPVGRRHRQYVAFSDDGYRWEEPVPILQLGEHIYRLNRYDDTWYGMVCDRDGATRRLLLIASTDLLRWEPVCQIGPTEAALNETDILFQPDGEAWIVARSEREERTAFFGSAKPPYTDWELTDLGVMVHSPVLLAHKGRAYLAGRCAPHREGDLAWPFGNSVAVWQLDRGSVRQVLRIPAVGDCAYPGLIEDADGRVCMSYYSQHAYYLGVVPPFGAQMTEGDPEQAGYASDVYFAELELP